MVEIPAAKHALQAVACEQPQVEQVNCATVGGRSPCRRLCVRRFGASDGILKKGRACRSKPGVRFCEDCPEQMNGPPGNHTAWPSLGQASMRAGA